MEHWQILLNTIDTLLRGEIDVPEFRRRYYHYYLDDVPEWALTDAQHDFFGGVQEKLDWVDEEPGKESRRAGWIDYKEFLSWLEAERRSVAALAPENEE